MASAPHLIFGLQESLYAVTALVVREIIQLPEVTVLAELPFFVSGVINLRGKVVPIVDLGLRLGYSKQSYQTGDSVIILEDAGTLIGVIVNEVHRVQIISDDEIEALPSFLLPEKNGESVGRFLKGIAKVEDEIVMLLRWESLLQLPEYSAQLELEEEAPINPAISTECFFCPEATPEERIVFRTRAKSLRQPLSDSDSAGLMPLAVIGLNGEYFGIDLAIIREFSTLRMTTPVPCCPGHIIGQMNLRGDILTLVDIRSALRMPLSPVGSNASSTPTAKVVVIESDALQVGVLVDEVFDVINLQPTEIRAVPSMMQSAGAEYLQGTAHYSKGMLGILDIPKILSHGALTVNEEL